MANYYLTHHGIKGQKWGVRRYQNADGSLTPAGKKRQVKLQRKWEKNVNDNWHTAYNRAADKVNKKLNEFNAKYEGISLNDNPKVRKKYIKEYCDMWNSIYEKELVSTLGQPVIDDGRKWADRVFGFMDADEEYETW